VVLIIIGTVGVIASAVACFLLAKLKKPIRIAGILVAVFFCIGLAGVASDRDFPRITSAGKTETETKTDTETETEFENSTESETETIAETEAEITEEPFYISEKRLTEGQVFGTVSQVWKNIKITEIHNDIDNSTAAIVYIYVNEATPQDNVKKYFEIVSKISDNCSKVFSRAGYYIVSLNLEVLNSEDSIFYCLDLVPKDGHYVIDDYPILDSFYDTEYRVAVNTIVEDMYKQSCEEYAYEDVVRYPQKYIGKKAYFTVRVFQVLESGDEVVLLAEPIGVIHADTIYVYYERKSPDEQRILEDDYIKMWGELDGLKTYENILGQSITMPRFNLRYYSIVGY
jgi:hypothetical protein